MLTALIPVFSLIIIGVVLRRIAFPGVEFWRGAERITYYLLFPALLFLKLSTINVSSEIELVPLVLLLLILLFVISFVLISFGRLFSIRAATFTSLFQGGIRFNTYVGLAVVNGVLGDNGLAVAAIVVGIMIPVVNLLCISVFAFMHDNSEINAASITRNILTNPLIIACVCGILWSSFDLLLPELSISILGMLSVTALPLGLLSVGAGVYVSEIKNSVGPLIISSIVKLLISPFLAYLLCDLFNQGQVVTMVVVTMASLPTASSAYILSRELGGDSKVMASIIAGQTVVAIFCMPVVISYLV